METKTEGSEQYAPSEDEEYMNHRQLEYFKKKLLFWKESLCVESSEAAHLLKEKNLNEPDLTDRANDEMDVSLELRTQDRNRKLIEKIDAALARIKNGVYGYCEETNEPIGLKRLEARPVATLAIAAQERHERFEKTHNED